MHNKILWIVLAIVVISGSYLAGFGTAAKLGGNGAINGGSYQNGFTAGMDNARSLLVKSGIIPASPEKITSISGTVKSIDGNKIVITANPMTVNPLEDRGPAERTIITSDKTKISVMVPYTADEFRAAMEKFNEEARNGKPSVPPSPYKEVAATFDDIKMTMTITVTSDDNIKTASQINASSINFNAIPSAPPETKK
jgi:hypothetical protein